MSVIDLKQPELYHNRELSLLEFNWRVLNQAKDCHTPLLERLRFLCISSSNLDEFFEVRVASLIRKADAGIPNTHLDRIAPQDTLKLIQQKTSTFIAEQYRVLNDEIIPALAREGIYALRRTSWTPAQEVWLRKFFDTELLPILSPIGLDPAHPFPRILNKSLNFIVSLSGRDAFGRHSRLAIVQVPRALPRIIWLPPELIEEGGSAFVFLSSVIHAYVGHLFLSMRIKGCYQFRVTRNSDLFYDEEETEDLLNAIKGELLHRHYGDTVRLEVTTSCPDDIVKFLLEQFELSQDELYRVDGPVNLHRLQSIIDQVKRPDLCYPPFTPALPARLAENKHIFSAIQAGDILLHHPFESFTPVIEFVRQAASDPDVLAIKQTLYRTGTDSAIVEALIAAARAGKEVTVVVELRARFDEEANVELATRLQDVGAHVVYGIVGYKTHAKTILIVRREADGHLRYYSHLGTGNYHSRTARIYTDYSLLTYDQAIGEDIHQTFLQLTSLGRVSRLNRLLQAPFSLHSTLLSKIQRETENASNGLPARLIIKVNSLAEPQLIQALYQAALAGVKTDLIVRGICCIRPGVSENIRVRSIIGRFLEHTRAFYFENNGQPEVFCASADWMDRNMFRRVELCFPIQATPLKQRIIADLEAYLRDNVNAWELTNDGSFQRVSVAEGETAFCAQCALLEQLDQHD